MRTVIVLPTYNEAKNIPELIKQLLKHIDKHTLLLFVDDSSPDGTASIIKKHKDKRIHLISGKKQGLGVAYLRGFDYAINKLKADVVFEMDSDLSHPAHLIPLMQKELQHADVVIGSRYIPGGDIPDWNFSRKAISWGGNRVARLITGLNPKDCTSGFRAIKTQYLKRIHKKDLKTNGYGFQITLLFELSRLGAKIKEVPLIFYDRKHGDSKLGKSDIIEFFVNACRLRWKKSQQFFKFGLVGASGVIVNSAALYVGHDIFLLPLIVASPLAIEISILSNFLWNNIWTFSKRGATTSLGQRFYRFHVTAFGGLLLNVAILLFLTNYIDPLGRFAYDYLIYNLFGIIAAFLWNYIINKHWTWRNK